MATNTERAQWADEALQAFNRRVGSSGEAEIDIGDLIGDLLHLARQAGHDPLAVAAAGIGAWSAEEVSGDNADTPANDHVTIDVTRAPENVVAFGDRATPRVYSFPA